MAALASPVRTHRMLKSESCRSHVEPKLSMIQQRTLLLCSDQDLLLPSREEGPRLKRKLKRCNLRVCSSRACSCMLMLFATHMGMAL